jgi:pimeloyl-ACP methyl ester carboxylesterase
MYWPRGLIHHKAPCLLLCLMVSAGCVTHRGEFFDADGVPLHYRVKGQGDPVILVHGIAVNARLNWGYPGITRALARDYQVVTFDNRGHGRSGKPHGPENYGVEMVEDVVRLMDHLGLEKAHVVGYSMGGFITLKLLTAHPDRLLSAAPCGAGWERRDTDGMRRLDEIARAIETNADYGPLLREVGLERKGFGRVKVFAVSKYFGHINENQAIADVVKSLPELEVSEAELRANQVPVLSIVGSVDPLKRGVDDMIGVLAHHEVVVVRRGSHYTTLNKRAMIEALRTFLWKHRSGESGSVSTAAGGPPETRETQR